MFVCLCKGVTDRTIRAEVARGACSPEEIAACTGAGTRCGSCREEVARIVEAELVGLDARDARDAARRALPVVREADAA